MCLFSFTGVALLMLNNQICFESATLLLNDDWDFDVCPVGSVRRLLLAAVACCALSARVRCPAPPALTLTRTRSHMQALKWISFGTSIVTELILVAFYYEQCKRKQQQWKLATTWDAFRYTSLKWKFLVEFVCNLVQVGQCSRSSSSPCLHACLDCCAACSVRGSSVRSGSQTRHPHGAVPSVCSLLCVLLRVDSSVHCRSLPAPPPTRAGLAALVPVPSPSAGQQPRILRAAHAARGNGL